MSGEAHVYRNGRWWRDDDAPRDAGVFSLDQFAAVFGELPDLRAFGRVVEMPRG
jgi:hypothetical protein